nr:VWA domain-containing protein [Virgibacillus natechei]
MIFVTVFLLLGCTDESATEDNSEAKSENETAENEGASSENVKSDEDERDQEQESQGNTELEFLDDIPSVPEDAGGLINQKQGEYADIDVRDDSVAEDVLEDIRKLSALPETASEEELNKYFNYLYSLVAVDFPDPQDTVNKWEFGSFGDPDLPDSRYHFKENFNVEVILDASGSMANYAGDQTRMQLAKESINSFLDNLPEEANVSLRIYGHKGTSENSDKELSCGSIEQIYGFDSYDESSFTDALNKFEPSGWTPLADALKQSEEALKDFDTENNTNLIYVVSDGIETCDGDPVQVAESLSSSNAQPIINIIGFQADADAQEQLQDMADVADGIYAMVNNQEELEEEFDRAEEVLEAWEEWKEDALKDVDSARVDNHFDIMEVTNSWFKSELHLKNNLTRLIRIFEDEGIVNGDQADEFRSKRDDVENLIDNTEAEIEENLKDISTETLEEMKNTINERYDQQTEE